MIKYKYQTLTKEDKKDARLKFYETELGKDLKIRFNRLFIYSAILLIFGISILIEAIIKNRDFSYYAYSIILLIAGFSFIILRHFVMIRKVNDFIISKKNKKK